MLAAFRSKNFRLFFIGKGVSLIGTSLTQVATLWLVYALTHSLFLLGIVGFASQIASFFLVPMGGLFADLFNRHRLLIVTQTLSMIRALTLAILALTNTLSIWHIIALSFCQGLINAIDVPIRQTFVIDVVDNKEDLQNAIALNSSLLNTARFIGPSLAGLLIYITNSGVCFLLDGISYIAVIYSLLLIKVPLQKPDISDINSFQIIKEGFIYAFNLQPIRMILLLLALVSITGMSYTVLIPVVATEILKGGADTLGLLMAASGIGALTAGIFLSWKSNLFKLETIIGYSPAILGISLIFLALSQKVWFSLIAMFLVGFSSILQVASSNTFLQTIVENNKRGRVMSLFTMSYLGMIPFGNLLAGSLASRIGVNQTLILAGSFCVLYSLIFIKNLFGLSNKSVLN